jgi:hypothetical protein
MGQQQTILPRLVRRIQGLSSMDHGRCACFLNTFTIHYSPPCIIPDILCSVGLVDSLYGQVWAYTLNLGALVNETQLSQHLAAEALYNDSPYGLLVVTETNSTARRLREVMKEELMQRPDRSCNDIINMAQFDSIWMGGNCSALAVHFTCCNLLT